MVQIICGGIDYVVRVVIRLTDATVWMQSGMGTDHMQGKLYPVTRNSLLSYNETHPCHTTFKYLQF